jgi:hypothetical protein
MSSFTKISPVGAELFHADEQTDITKLIVASHNFVNGPKNRTLLTFLLFGSVIFVEHK